MNLRHRIAVLLIILAGASAVVLIMGGPGLRQVQTPPAHADTRLQAPVVAAPALSHSEPRTLMIPKLGLTTPLDVIGLKSDGTVDDPATFTRPSWYRPGAAPGDRGSAVILGHVDSYRGPAVFFRLGELTAGDLVEVARTDGSTLRFQVDHTTTVSKDDFPNQQVYGDHGDAELQLVTCGGSFDTATRSYRSNVIVYTKLVGSY
ncbi:class F sortase [Nocardia concava]|uniref:class F sortase n=1 Tax=Nocardia concava TaxID=257281 RepID=UPI0002E8F549|nr:class F sortase [Nocardia concava]